MLYFYLSLIETAENKNKFKYLYDKYQGLLYYIANEILQDKFLAEDAVQEAFIKIINHLDEIEDISCHKTKGLCVIIAKSVSIDIYRKRKRQNRSRFKSVKFNSNENSTVEYDFLDNLETKNIVDAIKDMPEIYRNVLIFSSIYGYTDKQISVILNISCQAVRKRLERARQKLADILREGKEDEQV